MIGSSDVQSLVAAYRELHPWNLTPSEAPALQKELRSRLRIAPLDREVRSIAGADISFDKGSKAVFAGVVVLSLPELQVVEERVVLTETTFPYVPGLLSFREIPPLVEVWKLLQTEPDAVMLDGHGYAHPRRCGFASHFGLVVNRPTLGCAKTVLVGTYLPPDKRQGGWTPLVHKDEMIGAAVTTKEGATPLFISPGDQIDVPCAVELALRCAGKFRIPEPTRRAHLLVNAARRGEQPLDN